MFRVRTFSVPAMGLVTLLCVLPLVSLQKEMSFEMKVPASEPLTLLWGIADTTAYVGKLFTYTLPNDAFQGNIVHYDVSMQEKKALIYFFNFLNVTRDILLLFSC